MKHRILPFLVTQSKEKLTDRGGLAIVDEFMRVVGLMGEIGRCFPSPGSGRGMSEWIPAGKAVEFVRTLLFHFLDGGRFLEEIKSIKSEWIPLGKDLGFPNGSLRDRKLVKMSRMPGPDAVRQLADWLRRMGDWRLTSAVEQCIDFIARRYLSGCNEAVVLDVDATIIASEKGDGQKSYKGIRGYHPMLAFLSDGTDHPVCSYVKFRPRNASPQVDILRAIQHTQRLMPQGKKIGYFRSDSAAYQGKVIDYCNDHEIYYTITADLDGSVLTSIRSISSASWGALHDRKDRFKTGCDYAETIHTMNENNHSFRLIVEREFLDDPGLFDCYGQYRYRAIITNIPGEAMTVEEVIWHHNSRGNAERFIEDLKYGINLRFVPCGQFEANAMYFNIGILAYNLIKLMQGLVLPCGWKRSTIQSVRNGLFRMVAKVTTGGHRIWMQVNKTGSEIRQLLSVREQIYRLSTNGS